MRESRELEFKREVSNTFLKTVSAFANFGSGTIMFGIDDEGKAVGVKEPYSVISDIENRINDSVSPKPDYSLYVNSKNNVISLKVSEGKYKPYLYRGKAYRRSDTATVEADREELKRLTLEGENLYYEGLPCGEEALQFGCLEAELIERLGISGLSDDILRTFGLINKDKRYNIAAAVFADVNKYSGVDAVRFGDTLNEILDRETFAGISVLKQYDLAVGLFRRYYQYEIITGMERRAADKLPETAFREALANALVHRAWDVNSHVRISMFADRVEITSPGGLPKGITKEEYLSGYISNLRNPIIGNVFFRLHYIEMFGTGIRRILDSYAGCPLKPVFDITENAVRVTLPCFDAGPKVTSDGQRALELLNGGLLLSSSEIARRLGWSKNKTVRVLNALSASGCIRITGAGRGTKYSGR